MRRTFLLRQFAFLASQGLEDDEIRSWKRWFIVPGKIVDLTWAEMLNGCKCSIFRLQSCIDNHVDCTWWCHYYRAWRLDASAIGLHAGELNFAFINWAYDKHHTALIRIFFINSRFWKTSTYKQIIIPANWFTFWYCKGGKHIKACAGMFKCLKHHEHRYQHTIPRNCVFTSALWKWLHHTRHPRCSGWCR